MSGGKSVHINPDHEEPEEDNPLFDRAAPIARPEDPSSSHEAAQEITESGTRSAQCRAALELVRANPSSTSLELANLGDLDRYQLARRLADLRNAGQVENGEQRRCLVSGRNALTWSAVE